MVAEAGGGAAAGALPATDPPPEPGGVPEPRVCDKIKVVVGLKQIGNGGYRRPMFHVTSGRRATHYTSACSSTIPRTLPVPLSPTSDSGASYPIALTKERPPSPVPTSHSHTCVTILADARFACAFSSSGIAPVVLSTRVALRSLLDGPPSLSTPQLPSPRYVVPCGWYAEPRIGLVRFMVWTWCSNDASKLAASKCGTHTCRARTFSAWKSSSSFANNGQDFPKI